MPLTQLGALVVTTKDGGLVRSIESYDSHEEALEAAGLSE